MTTLRQPKFDVPEEEPFKYCKLDRKQYAEVLSQLIETYTNGFVLALNSQWGTGKTTFVKMWQQYLENNDFKTVYFNAWENDFEKDPMIAIMSELKELLPAGDKTRFTELAKKSIILGKSIIPGLVKAYANKHFDSEVLQDSIKGLSEASLKIVEHDIEEYEKKKKGLADFKLELTHYVADVTVKQPLIFFVDELDRCKPSYAVELLENIKHLFSVEGVVFILSMDKVQLEHAIKGYYGSDNIDSTDYLRRFIDLEYVLPEPDYEKFYDFLFTHLGFNEYFEERTGMNLRGGGDDDKDFKSFITRVFKLGQYSLRQQEKVLAQTRVVLKTFTFNSFLEPYLLVCLIITKNNNPTFYSSLKSLQLEPQEVIDGFENHFLNGNIPTKNIRAYTYSLAQLLNCYNNSLNYEGRKYKLITKGDNDSKSTNLITNLDREDFLASLEHAIGNFHTGDLKLEFFTNRIDLLEKIVT